jgi:hypothetical protein
MLAELACPAYITIGHQRGLITADLPTTLAFSILGITPSRPRPETQPKLAEEHPCGEG